MEFVTKPSLIESKLWKFMKLHYICVGISSNLNLLLKLKHNIKVDYLSTYNKLITLLIIYYSDTGN